MKYIRPLTILVVLIGFWKIIVVFTSVPPYILPPPSSVYLALISHFVEGQTTKVTDDIVKLWTDQNIGFIGFFHY